MTDRQGIFIDGMLGDEEKLQSLNNLTSVPFRYAGKDYKALVRIAPRQVKVLGIFDSKTVRVSEKLEAKLTLYAKLYAEHIVRQKASMLFAIKEGHDE